MTVTEVIDHLKQKADAKHHAGMTRFGIANEKALGVEIPHVRALAKLIKNCAGCFEGIEPLLNPPR